eukprot:CAMPEP_0174357640 /NCGR_PEP_ID=MMETSP0811_2-20130205/37278_1 /TAXON_ID=73025 ORGANISM="Eutreptiella gymnastica-like, Strain CCMP1594" /NCGR_SAMPLE_ID=MMETSP0811_2 /ASSEMBLY_ACC=CAM_ASM_000667 /LENGTH=123 /DNA_ID=CAMNT_0015490641 /DNA_START=160 /DNA_END=528 /DNA_ORIENTATION=+
MFVGAQAQACLCLNGSVDDFDAMHVYCLLLRGQATKRNRGGQDDTGLDEEELIAEESGQGPEHGAAHNLSDVHAVALQRQALPSHSHVVVVDVGKEDTERDAGERVPDGERNVRQDDVHAGAA